MAAHIRPTFIGSTRPTPVCRRGHAKLSLELPCGAPDFLAITRRPHAGLCSIASGLNAGTYSRTITRGRCNRPTKVQFPRRNLVARQMALPEPAEGLPRVDARNGPWRDSAGRVGRAWRAWVCPATAAWCEPLSVRVWLLCQPGEHAALPSRVLLTGRMHKRRVRRRDPAGPSDPLR